MQSRTRLQGRWNGIFSLESRAGLNNKAGRMELFMESHTGLDNAGGMEVECRWNAGGMELSLRCCQEWITMPVEWIFLGLSRRIG